MNGFHSTRVSPLWPRLSGLLALVAALLVASTALADSIKWRRTTLEERAETWRVDLEFHMSKPPAVAHVPMRFEFVPTVIYERDLVDGHDEPVMRRAPVENKSPLVESVEVGFTDPASGKTASRTRFTFELTREREFFAGEYTVTVFNKRSGRKIGAPTKLTLNGENEPVDRRSMVFSENKKKAQPEKQPEGRSEAEEEGSAPDPKSEDYWASGPTEPEEDESLPPPAHLQDKPGACGCRAVGGSTRASGVWMLLGLVGLAFYHRRRR